MNRSQPRNRAPAELELVEVLIAISRISAIIALKIMANERPHGGSKDE